MIIKTELFGSFTIHDGNDKYTLEANIDFNNKDRFYMPTFTFVGIKDKEYVTQDMSWDNDENLLQLNEALKNYIDFKRSTPDQLETLKELSEILDNEREDFFIIQEMIQKGIDIGMFYEALKIINERETGKN